MLGQVKRVWFAEGAAVATAFGRSRSSSSSSGAIGYDRDAGNGKRRTVTGDVDWVK